MGWNDSRISLLAPGWKMVSQEAPIGYCTASGERLRILDVERANESNSTTIAPSTVERWLEDRGFRILQHSKFGNRLQWEDVEAALNAKEGALAEVCVTFTLSRDSPVRVDIWKSLVEQLCENWGFALYVSDLGFGVHADEFLRVLSDTPAWQDFQSKFKWSRI
jgi:hypothetical protein